MSNLLGLNEETESSSYDSSGQPPTPDPELASRVKGGANWFYWIAALSVINSAAFLGGADVAFVVGLGSTLIVDAVVDAMIQSGSGEFFRVFAFAFNFIFVAIFALLGYYAGKRFTIAFILGIAIYTLDTLLVLAIGDWLMFGFHAFALFFIVRGFLAARKLRAFDVVNEPASEVSASSAAGIDPSIRN